MQSEDDGLDQATSVIRGWGGRRPGPTRGGERRGGEGSLASPLDSRLQETKHKCRAPGTTRRASFQRGWCDWVTLPRALL